MKKSLLTAIAGLITIMGFGQTTATDFTANDCAGNLHTLFTELDAGKVIVLTWVMPCFYCIEPASIVATTSQSYSPSNPDRIKFYLVDDYADNSCSEIADWASTNSISPNASFSDPIIKISDYGVLPPTIMQKTIVIGGSSHTVFFNVDGAIPKDPVDLKAAIVNALAAAGIVNNNDVILGLSLFPSPASIATKLNYTLTKPTSVTIDILNVLGEKVNSISVGIQSPGKHEYQLNLESLSEGTYFVKLNAGEATQTVNLSVVR